MHFARTLVLLVFIGQSSCGHSDFKATLRRPRSKDLPFGVGCLAWPMGDGHHHVSAGFHDPNYAFKSQVGDHDAIDIPAEVGTVIRASANGKVVMLEPVIDQDHAAAVTIRFGRRWTYYVGHLSRIHVVKGQYVGRGDVIGLSGGAIGAPGSGPWTTGPHLHFRLQRDWISVDPKPYLCP